MGTTSRIRKWIPIALCCIPVVAIAAIVGLGILVGGVSFGASFGGPLGLGLIGTGAVSAIVLALLVCPLHMGWMIWRMQKQRGPSRNSAALAKCCLPEDRAVSAVADPVVRLQELHTQREALERDAAELKWV